MGELIVSIDFGDAPDTGVGIGTGNTVQPLLMMVQDTRQIAISF